MTLRIESDLIQGTDDWLAARRGMVTASVVGKLVTSAPPEPTAVGCRECAAPIDAPCISRTRKTPTPIKTFHDMRRAHAAALPPVLQVADTEESRRLTATLAAERITGHTDPTYISADMWRGIDDEPRAVDHYSEHHAEVERVGFMVEDKWGFPIGYSPDGLVGDDGLIEVKSRRQHTHLLSVIADEAPAYNMAQLQCGLLVSGRKWVDYVSFCGGMAMKPVRVYPDLEWQHVIVAAVAKFETTAAEMVAAYNEKTEGLPLTERPTALEMVI